MLKLQLTSGDDKREIVMHDDPMTIGRSGDCEIKITDLKSSRRHARIEKFNGYYRVCDLETQNGTKVNGSNIQFHDLIKGDEIRIGEATVTILDLDRVPPAHSLPTMPSRPSAEVLHSPVPIEKKLELKHRIEEIRNRPPSKSSPIKTIIFAGMGMAAAIAVLIVVAAIIKENRPAPPVVLDPLVEAKKAATALQAKADSATTVSDALIAEVNAACIKWNDVLTRGNEKAASPFDQLFSTLVVRRAEQFTAGLEKTREAVDEHLKARRYSDALEALAKFKSGADTSFEETVKELVEKVDETVEKDFEAVEALGRAAEQGRRYEEAGKYYQFQAPRFQGTTYYTRIVDKPETLAAIAKAEKTALANREALAAARAEEIRKQNVIVEAPKPPVDVKPVDPKDPTPPPTPAKPVVTLPPFHQKIVDLANAGKFNGRSYKMTDKVLGAPSVADSDGLTINNAVLAWSLVSPAALIKMAGDLFQNDELLLATEFGYANGLAADADKLLLRYLGENKKERQAKVDQTLARIRGLESSPDGGYTYNEKTGWEDKTQLLNRTAFEDATKDIKNLVSASDAKKRDECFNKFFALFSAAEVSAENRDKMRAMAVAELQKWKDKNIKEISRRAKEALGLANLRALKTELNVRREAAIKFIYDEKLYLREDDPKYGQGSKVNGQDEVDRLVKLCRDLWEKPSDTVFASSGAIKKEIEELKQVNDKYLHALGEEVNSETDLKAFEEVMNNLNQTLNIKSYSINGKENELFNFGRRVDRYNDNLKESGITSDEIGHAKVVNDYREMMGRRRLFLDARICRATKKHSGACDKAGRIWHVGSDGDPQSRAQKEGFSAGVAENVCLGYSSPADTWTQGWYRASDHHRNGLNESWNCLGYGYVGQVGCENFSNIGTPKGF